MGELPRISGTYRIKDKTIEVQGYVRQDNLGCFFADFDYWHTAICYTKKIGNTRHAEFPLNGPGKSKLEKKIVRYLHSKSI